MSPDGMMKLIKHFTCVRMQFCTHCLYDSWILSLYFI